jgi:hypothetical protein
MTPEGININDLDALTNDEDLLDDMEDPMMATRKP